MTNAKPISTADHSAAHHSATNHEVNRAFVIRLSWDPASGEWRILLKPVNGQAERLFSNIEATLLYLEAELQKVRQS